MTLVAHSVWNGYNVPCRRVEKSVNEGDAWILRT